MSTAPQSPQQPEPQVETTRDEVRVRRAPKYPVFIFGGIIVGVVVTLIAVLVAPGRDATPFVQAFGYFVLYGITIGAFLGSVVAVVFDWSSSRRARNVETERSTFEAPEGDEGPEDANDDGAVEGELE